MKTDQREKYAEYISKGIQFALKQTGLSMFPDETVIVAAVGSPLSQIDTIVGIPVFVADNNSTFEFSLSFPAENESALKLLAAFREYENLYDMD